MTLDRDYVLSVAMKHAAYQDVEDVVQDALLKIHLRAHTYKGEVKETTWMYPIIVNTARDHHRRKSRRPEHSEELAARESDDYLARRQAIDDLHSFWKVVSAMTPKLREAFWHRYIEGLTEPEAAEVLGISVSAVKANANRAKNAALVVLTNDQ